MTHENTEIKTFTLWWRDGTRGVVQGITIADAFSKAGYGGGAMQALDWYDSGDVDTHTWNKVTHEWDRRPETDQDELGLTPSESQQLSEEVMESFDRARVKLKFNSELPLHAPDYTPLYDPEKVKNVQESAKGSLGSLMNQFFGQISIMKPMQVGAISTLEIHVPDKSKDEFKIDDSYPTDADIQEQKERAAKAKAYVDEHQDSPIGQKQHVRITAQIQMASKAKGLPLSKWEDVSIDLIMTDKHKAFGGSKEKLREAAIVEIGYKYKQRFIDRLKTDRMLARSIGGVKWDIGIRNLIVVNLSTTPLYAWELDDDYENRGFDNGPADDTSFALAP